MFTDELSSDFPVDRRWEFPADNRPLSASRSRTPRGLRRRKGSEAVSQKTKQHTQRVGPTCPGRQTGCGPDGQNPLSEDRSIRAAGVPGTHPRLYLVAARRGPFDHGGWHRGRRRSPRSPTPTAADIAGVHGAPRSETPAPPSWGGTTTYRNTNMASSATRPGHPLVHPAGTPAVRQNAHSPRHGAPSGCEVTRLRRRHSAIAIQVQLLALRRESR